MTLFFNFVTFSSFSFFHYQIVFLLSPYSHYEKVVLMQDKQEFVYIQLWWDQCQERRRIREKLGLFRGAVNRTHEQVSQKERRERERMRKRQQMSTCLLLKTLNFINQLILFFENIKHNIYIKTHNCTSMILISVYIYIYLVNNNT